jgi:hypothetical protein
MKRKVVGLRVEAEQTPGRRKPALEDGLLEAPSSVVKTYRRLGTLLPGVAYPLVLLLDRELDPSGFTTDEGASSRPSSRAGFRRPGEDGKFDDISGSKRSGSPNLTSGGNVSTPSARGKGTGKFDTPQSNTPIPSVLTPHHLLRRNPMSSQSISASDLAAPDPTASVPPMTGGHCRRRLP